MKKSKGQVTIFIIIAILIFAGVLAYFTLKSSETSVKIPANFEPIYDNFISCIEGDVIAGIRTLESQGGYIELPEFEPGSQYMPFSSQLNFLGNPIPYWYYVSGNNLEREQVPTKENMADQLEEFVESGINDCNFDFYYDSGFEISWGTPVAKSLIKDNEVEISLNMDLTISKGNETALVGDHKVRVNSELGALYDSAKTVYDEEQETLFLEEYTIDVLRLYAPVDGIELTCSPKVWNAEEVFSELQEGIEANILSLRTEKSGDDYFVLDLPVNKEVRFLNSKSWTYGYEVNPSEDVLMIANPVGNQPGLGIIGFCYVPYHFVYDVKYPVLVQVFSEEEIFQFPVAVIIENNNPRESLEVETAETVAPEFCTAKNTEMMVITKDLRGDPVQADVSYKCFGNKCSIGKTSVHGILQENFPQCVNGYVLASAPGFRTAQHLFSTVSSGSVEILLEKLYEKNIMLKVDGKEYTGEAIITFTSGEEAKTVSYPSQRFIELGEGQYEIQVYIYKNSSIELGATVSEQCVETTRPGILGFFGAKSEKCFDIKIPKQIISNSLAGGGTQKYYVSESELVNSDYIELNTESLPLPEDVAQIQENFLLFDEKGLEINFI